MTASRVTKVSCVTHVYVDSGKLIRVRKVTSSLADMKLPPPFDCQPGLLCHESFLFWFHCSKSDVLVVVVLIVVDVAVVIVAVVAVAVMLVLVIVAEHVLVVH